MQNKHHPNATSVKTSPWEKGKWIFQPFHLDPGLSLGLSTTTCSILRPSLPNGGHCHAALGEGVNEQLVWETESISTPSKGSLSPNHSPTESECKSGEIGVSPNMLLQSWTRHRHPCSEWPVGMGIVKILMVLLLLPIQYINNILIGTFCLYIYIYIYKQNGCVNGENSLHI